jgi:hypothetical protein
MVEYQFVVNVVNIFLLVFYIYGERDCMMITYNFVNQEMYSYVKKT